MNARGSIRKPISSRKGPKIRIKTFKLFLRLLKRPIIRSLPSKPSIKKTRNCSKQTSKNSNWVSVTKRKATLSIITPNKEKRAKRKLSNRMLKVQNFQIPSWFWRDVWIKLLKLTKRRESLWSNIFVMWRLLKTHLIKLSRQLVSQTLMKSSQPLSKLRNKTIACSITLTCLTLSMISLKRVTKRLRIRSGRLMKEVSWLNRKKSILRNHLLMKLKCLINKFVMLNTRLITPRICSKRFKLMSE